MNARLYKGGKHVITGVYDVNNDADRNAQNEIIPGIHHDSEPWNRDIANNLATEEEIQLTEAHYDVLGFLRQCHQRHGLIKHARSLTQALDIRFASLGGLKYLYTLFPKGPVSQGCKIAGMPIPGNAQDNAFGTFQ